MNYKNFLLLIFSVLAVSACNSTPPAKDFSGEWKSVNQLEDEIREFPLYRKYSFKVMPIDKTLKSLLARWAEDSRRSVDYRSCYDYSLPKQAENIDSSSLSEAIMELNQLYAEKDIMIREHPGVIVLESLESSSKHSELSCL